MGSLQKTVFIVHRTGLSLINGEKQDKVSDFLITIADFQTFQTYFTSEYSLASVEEDIRILKLLL